MAHPPAAIIDCGASRVALGVFTRRSSGSHCLEQLAVETLAAGTAREADWLHQTAAAAGRLRARLKWRGPVAVVLPAHAVLTKSLQAPRGDPAKREKVIRFEAQRSIPHALNDVLWAHTTTAETASGVEVLLCAAKREFVESLCAALDDAGLKPGAVVPAPFALAEACRALEQADAPPTVLLDVGPRATTLLLAAARQVRLRTALLSGGEPAPLLAARLAQEVTRSVVHFGRQSPLAVPARALLTGDVPSGLAERLQAELAVPVEASDPWLRFEIAPAADATGASPLKSQWAALGGAAALWLGPQPLGIDLLPPRWREKAAAQRRRPWLIVAAGLTVAAGLVPLAHFLTLERAQGEKLVAIEAELAPLRTRASEHRRHLERLGDLARKVAELQELQDRRVRWQQFLADLQDRLARVEDVWFDRLQLVSSAAGTDDGRLRVAVAARMLDRTNPSAQGSADASRRVTELLDSLARSPFVSAVEGERFHVGQPGVLRLEFVLVGHPARPLCPP